MRRVGTRAAPKKTMKKMVVIFMGLSVLSLFGAEKAKVDPLAGEPAGERIYLWSKAEPGTPSAEWKEMIWRWLVQMKFCTAK